MQSSWSRRYQLELLHEISPEIGMSCIVTPGTQSRNEFQVTSWSAQLSYQLKKLSSDPKVIDRKCTLL